jgi:hypothetical protein
VCVDEVQLMTAPDFTGYPLARKVSKESDHQPVDAKSPNPLLSPQAYVPVSDKSHAVRTLLACAARVRSTIQVRNLA